VVWPDDYINKIIHGDCLEVMKEMPDESVNCCVTSPPYWGLRDYGVDGQLGVEKTPEEYVEKMVVIFRELKRILRGDGTLWLNLGDSYSSGSAWSDSDDKRLRDRFRGQTAEHKPGRGNDLATHRAVSLLPKNLVGIPWRVAFALQSDGWYLRSDIIWSKPNPMPESVTDRPTKSHEYIFLLSKSRKYYYDTEAIRETAAYDGRNDEIMKGSNKHADGSIPNQPPHTFHQRGCERWQKDMSGLRVRNKRSVWTIATQPYAEAHFATFPEKLIEPCILAGCPEGGIVIDPFIGSGTTAKVAKEMKRNFIGIELNGEYIPLIENRTAQGVL